MGWTCKKAFFQALSASVLLAPRGLFGVGVNVIKKIIISLVAVTLVGVLGFYGYAITRMDLDKLLICATSDTAYNIPKGACSFYMRHLRDNSKDVELFDKYHGISTVILNPNQDDRFQWADFFIDIGMDVNLRGLQLGFTPLHSAIVMNDAGGVQYLLDHGANPMITDNTFHLNAFQFFDMLDKKNNLDRHAVKVAIESFKQKNPG